MMTSDDIVIRVRGLRTQFGRSIIHDGLDLDVKKGEVMAIVGGSGAGKSVLLNTIIGLNRQTAGTIEIFGEDTARIGEAAVKRIKTRWGVLFQGGALFSSLTVAQNVRLPMKEFTDLSASQMDELTAVKISMVGLPHDACAKYPSELSGGMQKRAGLARALALDPEILLLDEPTSGLDPIGAAAFDALIGDLQRSLNLTVVMVTHDLDSLYAIADRIAVLVDRHVVIGTLDEMLNNPHPWIQEYFHGPRARVLASG
ncbi:MAG: ABC transporter ATP-binding protein [Proteobacteria bacterium]|nr:ABC transporter ATP-binding protein [Pseudomonadota bacterium]